MKLGDRVTIAGAAGVVPHAVVIGVAELKDLGGPICEALQVIGVERVAVIEYQYGIRQHCIIALESSHHGRAASWCDLQGDELTIEKENSTCQ